MENFLPRRAAANPTQYNIEAIAKLEHEALSRRTPTERVSDAVTKLVGNLGFLLAQMVLVSGWILFNLHAIPGVKTFDPFPFGLLALVVSSEGVFLKVFVLISQGRMTRQSERRSHLDLQVGMLSEQELTTILQMLQKLCQHMGVNVDASKQEVQAFSTTTDVHKLASELEEKLQEESRIQFCDGLGGHPRKRPIPGARPVLTRGASNGSNARPETDEGATETSRVGMASRLAFSDPQKGLGSQPQVVVAWVMA